MPARSTVERFVALVESGDHVGAIEAFYAEDASMQENLAPPRVGKAMLIAHEKAALARVASVHTHKVKTLLVDGDQVAIHWIFDFTLPDGSTRRFDEMALQTWRGEEIVTERFFYDPATTR
ncbi:nuclear transport factor 2 family protein [Phreatobacter cathodiphilus]|uniref:Polyketide cyclase n=1 Tax=Phreatobacter cathodiphilus TaxID=1868589 RepID=A0A2S0ND70_9HYPH|nr:nuclear transport factor 2 family protein [Phreatobacter cathodiphilus]AVO46095.1 polyketide cyclase [Phreatobacter cathodiphilus]